MSGIFHKIARFFNLWMTNTSMQIEPTLVYVSVLGAAGHAIYARGTQEEETLKVEGKYQIYQPSGTQFVVYGTTSDGQYHHLVVPYSLWYWQFDVPEIWNRIEPGSTYRISYYGYRVPSLNIFENIVALRHD